MIRNRDGWRRDAESSGDDPLRARRNRDTPPSHLTGESRLRGGGRRGPVGSTRQRAIATLSRARGPAGAAGLGGDSGDGGERAIATLSRARGPAGARDARGGRPGAGGERRQHPATGGGDARRNGGTGGGRDAWRRAEGQHLAAGGGGVRRGDGSPRRSTGATPGEKNCTISTTLRQPDPEIASRIARFPR